MEQQSNSWCWRHTTTTAKKDNKRHTVKDTFLLCKYVESLLYHHHQIKNGCPVKQILGLSRYMLEKLNFYSE
jgi:hypothetical protein